MNKEGFWASPDDKKTHQLPKPKGSAEPWIGKQPFLDALTSVESRCRVEHYRGWSTCRICGTNNGSAEYYWGDWVWPSGYMHYITDHNVRPSLAFQEMILNKEI